MKKITLNQKKIKSIIGQTLLAICIMASVIAIFRIYRITHHGFDSSDEVIRKFISAYAENDIYDIEMCFNKDMSDYNIVLKDIYNSMTGKFTTSDINIESTVVTNQMLDDLSENIAITNIDMINSSTASYTLNTTSTDGHKEITSVYNYTHQFITYEIANKWYIASYKLNDAVLIDQYRTVDGQSMLVGDDIIGYMTIPENWKNITINSDDTTVIAKDASYIAPDKTAMITISAISQNINQMDIIQDLCGNFSTQGLKFSINDKAMLNNTPAIMIIATDNQTSYITYVFTTEYDNYVHTIELVCLPTDLEWYNTNYLQIFEPKFEA